MLSKPIKQFIDVQISGGIVLLVALILALIFANSSLKSYYDAFLDLQLFMGAGNFELRKVSLALVNEGLMSIFFLVLALEIKREFVAGELANRSQIILPVVGAISGIIGAGAIYAFLNHGDSFKMLGWPIATTTDIAFALSIIAVLGKRVPHSLKAMLIALSIVDDILAIVLVAAFYSDQLAWWSLALSGVCLIFLIILNMSGVKKVAPYILIGVVIWALVLKSGVHATLAGVAVGLAIPYDKSENEDMAPSRRLEKSLHPWVTFGILPLFVFMNGGVSFAGITLTAMLSTVPLGIAAGLFLGKSIVAFVVCWLIVKIKYFKVSLPSGSNMLQLLALLFITGIGFTMSLFIASLAFNLSEFEEPARQGVLLGSLCSAIVGIVLFIIANPKVRKS